MSPFLGALLLTFMFYFNEIETSGFEKKRKINEQSSSKEDKNKITIDSTDETKQKEFRKGRVPAEFLHVVDKTGNNAYSLFVEHYRRHPLPPPEAGVDAYLLFERMENHRLESSRTNSKGSLGSVDHHSSVGSSNRQPHPSPSTNNDSSNNVYQYHEIPASGLSSEHQNLQERRSNVNNPSRSEAVDRNDSNPGNQHGGQCGGSE